MQRGQFGYIYITFIIRIIYNPIINYLYKVII